jgi:hypothetical protein
MDEHDVLSASIELIGQFDVVELQTIRPHHPHPICYIESLVN